MNLRSARSDQLCVDFKWVPIGTGGLDSSGLLTFPRVDPAPGVYRFSAIDGDATWVYVGETHNLHQRLHKNYRRPPSRAQTSIWVNAWLTELLRRGIKIAIDLVVDPIATSDGQRCELDVARKSDRLLIEAAAITLARHCGFALKNKPGVNDRSG